MNSHRVGAILATTMLVLCVSSQAVAEMDAETERLARWQLNNADLLVDEGRYMEAVEYIDSAYEVSRYPKTRSDALLAKAMIMATFLDAPQEAINAYSLLAKEFPVYAEIADYQSAFLLFQGGKREEAKKRFRRYLKQYPNGRFRFQTEAVLQSLGVSGPEGPVDLAALKKRPVLRVALARKGKDVMMRSTGEGGICTDGIGCVLAMSIEPFGKGLSVNGKPVGGAKMIVTADSPPKVTVRGRTKRVRGAVAIANRNGRLLVLNLIDIEDYLLSVVPSESYASWPLETLKAQAVASRTYAYYQKLHRSGREYDILDDTRDQMYGGVGKETKRTTRAVTATAGCILTYSGKPILSQYTANSGGYTADAGAVFGTPKPYLVAHGDPASLKGKMASWKRSYSTSEIVRALHKIGVDVSGLTAIEPAVTGPSGRLVKVRLRHARGATIVRTRTTLASSRVLRLPEVLMNVGKQGDSYIFKGRGHGHGVGYSQWGSAVLGKKWSYDKILGFYYPETALKRNWN